MSVYHTCVGTLLVWLNKCIIPGWPHGVSKQCMSMCLVIVLAAVPYGLKQVEDGLGPT